MELYVGGIGAIAAVFVVIFGGRGLIDLVRGYSERRRARIVPTDEPSPPLTAVPNAVESHEAAEPTPAVPLVEPDPVYRRTFVGRDAELQQLHDAFDEALAGHGSLAMVVGEPGIGKTSLCEQLAAYVAEKAGKTLVGHCYEEGSLSLPYLAFVEAVRSYVLVLEPNDLKAQLAQGADALARIVPEIRERMGVELPSTSDPEEERYRLLQAASDFLRNAAAVQPLLVVLEDLHDADRGTLDMLTHLARNLSGSKLLVIGTYRDVQVDRSHPLAAALAELRRVTSFERIPLRGLTQDEVHRMLQAIAGHDVPWRWAEVVHRQTEGNPLFVQEVMRYLVEEGLLAREDGKLQRVGDDPLAGRIPEGLRDVIGRRLTRLGTQTDRVLSVAAVIGREFRFDVLQQVADLPDDPLIAALDEGREAAVLEERTATGGAVTYRFGHAFFRQTLYDEISAPRRILFHQRVARALEQVHARTLGEHAAELAEHFSHSSSPDDLSKAVDYAEMAAGTARDVYAYGEAVRLLELALDAQEVLDPDDSGKRCDLLLALGDALMPAGDPRRAYEAVAPEALSLAEALDDGARASRACQLAITAMTRFGFGTMMTTPEYLKWLERAGHYAPPASADRVRVDMGMALVQASAGQLRESLVSRSRALELARRLDSPEALFGAASVNLAILTVPEAEREKLALAEEFAERSRSAISVRRQGQILWNLGHVFLSWGQRDRALDALRQMDELATRTRDPGIVLNVMHARAAIATIDGRLEAAVAGGAELIAHSEELGIPIAGRFLAATISPWPLVQLGRTEEALALASTDGASGHLIGAEAPFSAWALAFDDRTEEARLLLDNAVRDLHLESAEHEGVTPSLVMVLEAATLLQDRPLAARVEGLLSSVGDLMPLLLGFTCVARHLGAAAALLGRPDDARRRYDEALGACRRLGARAELALTRSQIAELLLDHYPDERADAIEHLDFAIAELREMKMQPSLEKAEALRAAQTN